MKKKIIIPILCAVVVAVSGTMAGFTFFGGNKDGAPVVRTVALEKSHLVNTVDVTGIVKSMDSTEIYSPLSNAKIASLEVAVGDVINAGDVICTLDTSGLEDQLAQAQAKIWESQQKTQFEIAKAQKDLETLEFNYEKEYDAKLANAKGSIDSAELSVADIQRQLSNARRDREDYRYDFRENNLTDPITGLDIDDDTYRDKIESYRRQIDALETQLKNAENSLALAKDNLKTQEILHKEDVISQKDRVKSAELQNNYSSSYLANQQLMADIAKGVVTSPVTGTVTAVIAKEGTITPGAIIVVEDTQNLKIKTKIKEYDLPSVSLQDKVVIKSDGAGDVTYEGSLMSLAPTSLKTDAGTQIETTDPEFETEIAVVTTPNNLKIGMNTRLNIIIDEREAAFGVQYDAIITDSQGNSGVYVAREQEDGSYAAKFVSVTLGLETDFNIEVISDELQEGDMIITDISAITDGMAVTPDATIQVEDTDDAAGRQRGMMGGGMAVRMG